VDPGPVTGKPVYQELAKPSFGQRLANAEKALFLKHQPDTLGESRKDYYGVIKATSFRSNRMIEAHLNEATQEQLEKLPGVGPYSAKKIIASRPYESVMELSKIGFSGSIIKRIIRVLSLKSAGQ
jgi:DNA uptake protein ComE-like DNA-binding protein